jgi:hypothetical protein
LALFIEEDQTPVNSRAELLKLLEEKINYLIERDFNGLLALLYRLDVDEKKINTALNGEVERNAGEIIAEIILEREEKKAEWRKKMKENNPFNNTFDDENERW